MELAMERAMQKRRAFDSHGAKQASMCKAADYHDQWYNTEDAQLRVFYICKAGHAASPCLTVTLSTGWDDLLKEDRLRTGQRWYCPRCKARYAPRMGLIMELCLKEHVYYLSASFPDADMQDVKAMAVEQNIGTVDSALDVLACVIRAEPLNQEDVLKPLLNLPDSWQMDKACFESLPKLDWNQLYNLNLGIPQFKKGKPITDIEV